MLPAFLSFYLGASDPDRAQVTPGGRVGHGLAVGLAVSAGFAGVFVAAALLAAAGLGVLVRLVPWAAVGIGLALVGLGGWLLAGRRLGLTVPSRLHPEAGRSYRRIVAFGGAYALASLSCTLAVLLALIGQALATASPLRLAGVLAGYVVGAAAVLMAVSVSVAVGERALVGLLRRLLPFVGRLGGGLLVVSGAYLVIYWAPTLAHRGEPAAPPALVRIGTALSARLTSVLLAGQSVVAVLTGALVVGGIAWAVRQLVSRRHAGSQPPPGGGATARPATGQPRSSQPTRQGGEP
jgi:cytochrome c-type biogenesis protein